MKSCYFVSTGESTFVKLDMNFIKSHYQIIDFVFDPSSLLNAISSMIRQFFSLLISIHKIHVYYIWFADYHSLLPILFSKLFNRKSILILGGSDCLSIPELGIGNIYGGLGLRKFCVVQSLRFASTLAPVDETLINNKNTYIGPKVINSGIQSFIDITNKDIRVKSTSIDTSLFKIADKERVVLSVVSVNTRKRISLKGVDIFLEIAEKLPNEKFVLIGIDQTIKANLNIPHNVEVHEFVDQSGLIKFYSKAKVFCLLSLYEGMPNVVLEAIASGCIPVLSDVSGMTTLGRRFGYIVEKKDSDLAVKQIISALNDNDIDIEENAELIRKEYHLDERKTFVSDLISKEWN